MWTLPCSHNTKTQAWFFEHISAYLHIHVLNQIVSALKNNIDKMNQLSSLLILSRIIQKRRDLSQLSEQPFPCLCSGHLQAKALHTATVHTHTPVAQPVCEWGSSSQVNRERVVRAVRSYQPFLPDGLQTGVSRGTRKGSQHRSLQDQHSKPNTEGAAYSNHSLGDRLGKSFHAYLCDFFFIYFF